MRGDEASPAPYPDPRVRVRPQPTGTTIVTLADGNPWLLADGGLGNVLDEVRDRLYRGSRLDNQVVMGDVIAAAGEMLAANYELSGPEIGALVMGLGRDEAARQSLHDGLVKAVMAAMFGTGDDRGYTEWARASLLANGLDPAIVPSTAHRSVLAILTLTGRTIPVDQFVDSIRQANAFSDLLALARPVGG